MNILKMEEKVKKMYRNISRKLKNVIFFVENCLIDDFFLSIDTISTNRQRISADNIGKSSRLRFQNQKED
jgi:hypothetical protein